MAEPAVVLIILDKILRVLGLIRAGQMQKDEKIDQSLRSLYTALIETKAYVRSLNNGKGKNRDKELHLAELWHDASVPLRKIDPILADKCYIKGSYWLEPEAWNEARLTKHQIKLDQVCKETRKLLAGM